jgi:hypothetical protein
VVVVLDVVASREVASLEAAQGQWRLLSNGHVLRIVRPRCGQHGGMGVRATTRPSAPVWAALANLERLSASREYPHRADTTMRERRSYDFRICLGFP